MQLNWLIGWFALVVPVLCIDPRTMLFVLLQFSVFLSTVLCVREKSTLRKMRLSLYIFEKTSALVTKARGYWNRASTQKKSRAQKLKLGSPDLGGRINNIISPVPIP